MAKFYFSRMESENYNSKKNYKYKKIKKTNKKDNYDIDLT